MSGSAIILIGVWLLIIWMIVGIWRIRRKRVSIGPAAMGSMEDLLDDRRRAAIQIIIEERTGERDPEDRDGNLPDLESPRTQGPPEGGGPYVLPVGSKR